MQRFSPKKKNQWACPISSQVATPAAEIGIIIAIIIIVYLGRIHRPFFFRRLLAAYTEKNSTSKISKILKSFGNFGEVCLV